MAAVIPRLWMPWHSGTVHAHSGMGEAVEVAAVEEEVVAVVEMAEEMAEEMAIMGLETVKTRSHQDNRQSMMDRVLGQVTLVVDRDVAGYTFLSPASPACWRYSRK